MHTKIAIQGIIGSNHHKVAQQYFGEHVSLDECLSFDALVASLISKKSSHAVMALENTIAGSIIPNYARIDDNDIHINGEYYLNIHHHLMALPGQTLDTITEVSSHPMALLQCKEFFKQYPHIKLVEAADTAAVAQQIQATQQKGIAAIATETAAKLFQLEIISSDIQTIKTNATRFVILQTGTSKKAMQTTTETIDKASLRFQLDHKRGSLATVLNIMSDCKLNLTKIQSLPIIQTPWKYAFFVDVTFDHFENYEKAISVLHIMTTNLKVLGTYKNQQYK